MRQIACVYACVFTFGFGCIFAYVFTCVIRSNVQPVDKKSCVKCSLEGNPEREEGNCEVPIATGVADSKEAKSWACVS